MSLFGPIFYLIFAETFGKVRGREICFRESCFFAGSLCDRYWCVDILRFRLKPPSRQRRFTFADVNSRTNGSILNGHDNETFKCLSIGPWDESNIVAIFDPACTVVISNEMLCMLCEM